MAAGGQVVNLPFALAVMAYDAIVLTVFGLDFIAFSRRNDTVIAKGPALLLAAVLAIMAPMVSRRVEFTLLGVLVLGAAIFGYANFLAFVKRGVTFSIVSNHTRPAGDRVADFEFIAIGDRLDEMRRHGWASEAAGQWELTRSGHRVARIRRRLMRILRIEAVG